MTRFEGTRHGKLIASQMLDVTIRVKDIRPFAVRQMVREGEESTGACYLLSSSLTPFLSPSLLSLPSFPPPLGYYSGEYSIIC